MNKQYLDILAEVERDEAATNRAKLIGNTNPIMITLLNTSGTDKTNVDFLYATESIWDQTRYGLPAGVTGGAGYANITYRGVLSQLMTHDITIGAFLIESTTNAAATATILFRTDNQRGKALEETIVVKISPNWKQAGIAYFIPNEEVKITAWTKATISNLYNNVPYRISMYPTSIINNGTKKVYNKAPNILKTNKL